MTQPDTWPFDDPPNTAAITTADVLEGRAPVALVTHDEDDGAFQFLPPGGAPSDWREGRVVGLRTMLAMDPTLAEVADLPMGWWAWREGPGKPWTRSLRPTRGGRSRSRMPGRPGPWPQNGPRGRDDPRPT